MKTRGLYDPRPLLQIQRLKEIAIRRGYDHALEILEEARRELFIDQYADLSDLLQGDISRLGIIAGNQEKRTQDLDDFDEEGIH